jgi:hypothetical protein
MAHAFIGGKHHVETGPLRFGQQVAIAERIPSSVFGLDDGMTRRNLAIQVGVTWSKRISILSGVCYGSKIRVQAAQSEFEYRVDLFKRNVELLDDFVDAGCGFEVLE